LEENKRKKGGREEKVKLYFIVEVREVRDLFELRKWKMSSLLYLMLCFGKKVKREEKNRRVE